MLAAGPRAESCPRPAPGGSEGTTGAEAEQAARARAPGFALQLLPRHPQPCAGCPGGQELTEAQGLLNPRAQTPRHPGAGHRLGMFMHLGIAKKLAGTADGSFRFKPGH